MFDRDAMDRIKSDRRVASKRPNRRSRSPRFDDLEGRPLMATLATIPNVSVPQLIGYQMPLDGGSSNNQTYTVTSSNPNIQPTVAQGQFWTVNVAHTSSGSEDVSFAGSLTFQLFEDLTPTTVERITTLIEQGFYTNKNFHRIASGFPSTTGYIVQGGSVSGTGTGEVGQPGFPFADEFVQQLGFTNQSLSSDVNSIYYYAGQLAMANAGDDTNSSQFFVTTANPQFLNYNHTIFGQLVSGQETLRDMINVARTDSTPTNPITITSTSLSNVSPDGVIHIDTTKALAGETATLTVTATDPTDNSTTTRSFTVTTNANIDPSTGRTMLQDPFLVPVANQVVGVNNPGATTLQGQTAVFQLQAVQANPPGTTVKYIVKGGVASNAFTNVTNATASVDANGVVTVTPNAGFLGTINLLVGVGGPSANEATVADWDTQTITLTVNNSAAVNLPPIAISGTSSTTLNTPVTVQLAGNTANPASSQTLTYEIVTAPAFGTITNFNATTGTFIYTPNPGFNGSDTVIFRVRDHGEPTPNLASTVNGMQTIRVGAGDTQAVRLINDVLIISAPQRSDSVPNIINIANVGGNVVTTVNDMIDSIQPAQAGLLKIIIDGSKANDEITVDPRIVVPTTINSGRGGTSKIQAGNGATRAHLWFGRSRITGGNDTDTIIGGAGRFQVKFSGGDDLIFAGRPRNRGTLHRVATPPGGTFYRWTNGVLTPRPTPTHNGSSIIDTTDTPAMLGQLNAAQIEQLLAARNRKASR